jgi:hypothetical protein
MKHLHFKASSRKLTAMITLALVLLFTMSAILPNVTAFAESSTFAGDNSNDVHDDRPDDTGDRPDDDRPVGAGSVGGDNSTATTSISDEARAWANASGFDLAAFENYSAPAVHEPTDADIAAFENWMRGGSNPRNQVLKQIQSAAGDAIANELWNYCNTIWKTWMNAANVGSVVSRESGLKNVGAMQEGMFAGYFGSLIGGGNGGGGYGNAATLIQDGFVVSSDGVTYRLHNMIDGSVAYGIAAPESVTVSEDEFPEGLTSFTDFFPLEKHEATAEAIALLKQYASGGSFNEPSNADRAVYQSAATYVNEKFGDYFGQCPGPTVVKGITALGIELDSVTEDTVGSSVGEKEFVASFFGTGSAAASLWRLGFLPSFDGTTYRLHSGKDGTVVYEITAEELLADADALTDSAESSDITVAEETGAIESNGSIALTITIVVIAVLIIAAAVILVRTKLRRKK